MPREIFSLEIGDEIYDIEADSSDEAIRYGKQIAATPFPAPKGRFESALNVAAEATGAPSVFRAGEATAGGRMPDKMDIATLAAIGIPGATLGRSGISAFRLGGALAGSALGAGAGQAIAGPEAAAAGERLSSAGHPIAGAALSALPALAGGIGGPIAARSVGLMTRAGGQALFTGGPSVARETLSQAIPDLPITGGLKSAEGVNPQALAAAKELEARIPGMVLGPDQAMYLQGGMARNPLLDIAYRGKQSEAALSRLAKQQEALAKQARGIAGEKAGAGAGAVGQEIQQAIGDKAQAASDRYGMAIEALQNSPDAMAGATMWKRSIQGEIADLRKNADVKFSPAAKEALNDLEGMAGDINNAYEAALFRKQLKSIVSSAASKLQSGEGKGSDVIVKRLGSAIDDSLSEISKNNKGVKPLFDELLDASGQYWSSKFSPQGEMARRVAGIKKVGAEPIRKPEDVVGTILRSPQNEAARILSGAAGDGITPEQVRQAAKAAFVDVAVNVDPQTGASSLNYGRLKGWWDNIPKTQKEALFSPGDQTLINNLIQGGDVATFLQRYQPPTGASLPVLAPVLEGLTPRGLTGMLLSGARGALEKGKQTEILSRPASAMAIPNPSRAMAVNESILRTVPAGLAPLRDESPSNFRDALRGVRPSKRK